VRASWLRRAGFARRIQTTKFVIVLAVRPNKTSAHWRTQPRSGGAFYCVIELSRVCGTNYTPVGRRSLDDGSVFARN